jgi:hypothetical protein
VVPAAVLALAVLAEKMWRAIHAILLDAAVVASSADDARVLAYNVLAQHKGFRKALALLADLAHLAVLAAACGAAPGAVTLAPSRAAACFAGLVDVAKVLARALLARVPVLAVRAPEGVGRTL